MSLEKVLKYKKKIEKIYRLSDSDSKLLSYLKKLDNVEMNQSILEQTKVGITVNNLRQREGKLGEIAKRMVHGWSEMVKRNLNADKTHSPQEAAVADTQPVDDKKFKKPKDVPKPPPPPQEMTNGSGVNESTKKSRKTVPVNGADPKPAVKEDATRVGLDIQRQNSGGVDANSGFSFGDLLSANDSSVKRKRKALAKEAIAPAVKKARSERVTDAEIRKSLSVGDVDYAKEFNTNALLTSMARDVTRRASEKKPEKKAPSEDSLAPLKLNSRSVVYCGRVKSSEVLSLQDLCLNVFYKNVDYIGELSERAQYHILESFLARLTVPQLERIERFNEHLVPDDDKLWMLHCQRDHKSCPEVRREHPPNGMTWRQLYIRLRNNEEKRLNALKLSISAENARKNEGERKAKIAFEWVAPKAPREVRRQQAKFGTNRFDAVALANPQRKVDGEQRKFVRPAVEEAPRKPKKSTHMKKLISSIKRSGYTRR